MLTNKLISFICSSRNLDNIRDFLNNLEETVHHPDLIECLFKFDLDQHQAKSFIESEIKARSFSIKYIITPRLNGLNSVGVAYNDLFTLVSPDSYFVQVISDEVRFSTKYWDDILKKYVGFFSDHVFRLRMSQFKLNTYPSLFSCNLAPDSFHICTKHWLDLTLGYGTHCWASDIVHQFIAYHLSLGEQGYQDIDTPFYDNGIHRDVQLLDITFSGLDFGVGVSEEIQKNRGLWVTHLWNKNMSHYHQEYFSYLAKRLSCYIWAKSKQLSSFKIVQNKLKKTVQLIDDNGSLCREVSYRLPRIHFFVMNIKRKWKVMKKTLFWWYQRTIVRLVNYFLGKCNAILDRCYTYKRLRLINVLSEIRLFRFMTPFFVALKTLDAEMPVERYGRIQKNVIFFLMVFRFILDCFFGRIQELMVGPPPGLSDKRSFFGMLCGSVWPKSLFKISDEDAQWARDAIKKQEKIFKDMENRPHRLDTESVS